MLKFISKGDWLFAAVASTVLAILYTYYTGGKQGFFFAWSALFAGLLIGLFLYAGVKRLVTKS